MAGIPPKITVSTAISYLKSGQYLAALKYFYYLKRNMSILSQNDQNEVNRNLELCLKLLFDRQLATIEEAIQNDDDIETSIYLMNLLDLIGSLIRFTAVLDKSTKKSIRRGFQLFEIWVLNVLSNIRSSEIKKRHFARHYQEVLNKFGYISMLYSEFFLKYPNISEFFQPNKKEFTRITDNIYKEFVSFFFDQLDKALKQTKLLRVLELRQILHLLIQKFPNERRLDPRLQKSELVIAEKLAEFDIFQGDQLEDQHEYYASTQKFRSAYKKYHLLENPSKKKQIKNKFLHTTILLGKSFEKQAIQSKNDDDPEVPLQLFYKAQHIYQDINAKKELTNIESNIHDFYELVGDRLKPKADSISEQDLDQVSKKLSLLNEVRRYYFKAENQKKVKRTEGEIEKLYKIKYRELSKNISSAQKMGNFELKYLYLEDLHLLSYEMNNEKNVRKIAKELDKLKVQVNFKKLEDLKSKKLASQFVSKEDFYENTKNTSKNKGDNLNNFILNEDQKPNAFDQETQISLQSSLIDETWFISHEEHLKQTQNQSPFSDSPDQTRIIKSLHDPFSQSLVPPKSPSLRQIYEFVKKHNKGKVLTNEEIDFLFSHGINLPRNVLYYYRFPQMPHQFYVFDNPRGGPQVLIIPKNVVIGRGKTLGEVLPYLQHYLGSPQDFSVISQDILLNHIKFAQVYKHWDDYLTSFQYSSLDIYVNFLHALRLLNNRALVPEIAKYINSSLIAEFLNVPTDRLIEFIEQFSSITFVEEILGFTNNRNFHLFAFGLKYFYAQKIELAANFWSMLEIG
ncbi:MAG: hypothetical protein ACTSYI_14800 [Promethearchaeota archaeon]